MIHNIGLIAVIALALVAANGLSYLHYRYYTRTVNRLIREHNQPGRTLVTGRYRGRFRGAVALLVVRDGPTPTVERAMVMKGTTVLARFQEHPELLGTESTSAAVELAPSFRQAVDDAFDRYRDMIRNRTGSNYDDSVSDSN